MRRRRWIAALALALAGCTSRAVEQPAISVRDAPVDNVHPVGDRTFTTDNVPPG